jgi:diacylglycerol kinase family enzyme
VKLLLVVNAVASSVTARRQVIVGKILSADHDVEVVETNRRGHATALAADAARAGCDVVVCLGGDGTLNELANGLVGTECALAALPGGSTNVFARSIGLPDEMTDAALVISEALEAGAIRRVGVGSANGRYFLFHLGIGWDAALVKQVERRSKWKRYAAHPLFVWVGLRVFFFTYDRRHPHFRMDFPDGSTVEDGYFSVCMNLDPYTYVGHRPFHLSPATTLDSGLTSVCVRSMRASSFGRLMFSALRDDSGVTPSKTLDLRTDLSSLQVAAYGTVPYQVDGDYLGEIDVIEIRHHPESLNMVIPRSSALE